MTIQASSDLYQPDENTFLCGYKRVRRYGTTQPQSAPITPNSYTMYQVKTEDTLEGIALRHNCSVSALVRANKLWSPSALFMKEFIRIPTFTADGGSSQNLAQESKSASQTTVSQSSSNKRVSNNDERSMKDIFHRIDKTIKVFKKYEPSSDSILYDSECN